MKIIPNKFLVPPYDCKGGINQKAYHGLPFKFQKLERKFDSCNQSRWWKFKQRFKIVIMAMFSKKVTIFSIKKNEFLTLHLNRDASEQVAVHNLLCAYNQEDLNYSKMVEVDEIYKLN